MLLLAVASSMFQGFICIAKKLHPVEKKSVLRVCSRRLLNLLRRSAVKATIFGYKYCLADGVPNLRHAATRELQKRQAYHWSVTYFKFEVNCYSTVLLYESESNQRASWTLSPVNVLILQVCFETTSSCSQAMVRSRIEIYHHLCNPAH